MEPLGKEKTSQERIDEFMELYERNQSMRKMFNEQLGEGWEPLGDCPLMGILPIRAIKMCREKHKKNCHTIKINYLRKCGGNQEWKQMRRKVL